VSEVTVLSRCDLLSGLAAASPKDFSAHLKQVRKATFLALAIDALYCFGGSSAELGFGRHVVRQM